MSNWFPKKGRGLLMGIWSGQANIGDIIGLSVIGQLSIQEYDLGW